MKLEDVQKISPNGLLTHSLVVFDVLNPKPEDLRLIDIAHALSNLCRYGGHSPEFYSVAQHAVLCSYFPGTPIQQLKFLHHDDSEGLLVDMPRPIKKNLPQYVEIEERLQSIIFPWLGLEYPFTDDIHWVDNEMLKLEYKAFYGGEGERDPHFEFWSPKEAKIKYLNRHEELISLI
jgi:hypothetical protein